MHKQSSVKTALERAVLLAAIASDWNLDEIEVGDEMVRTFDLMEEFKQALIALKGMERDSGLCAAGIVLAYHRKTHDHIIADEDTVNAARRVESYLGSR